MTTNRLSFAEAIGLKSAMWQEHPALLFTLIYFLASTIGMLFSWSLYRDFDVNVFAYAEITDFLMAALREPVTFLLAAGSLVVAWIIWWLALKEQRLIERKPPKSRIGKLYAAQSTWFANSRWTVIFVVVMYAGAFITLYADEKGKQLRNGIGKQVVVVQDNAVSDGPLMLLGTTSRLVFVFDRDTEQVSIVPYESITRIDVVAEPPAAIPEPAPPEEPAKPAAAPAKTP